MRMAVTKLEERSGFRICDDRKLARWDRVVGYAARPMFRAQIRGTFKFLFNVLYRYS